MVILTRAQAGRTRTGGQRDDRAGRRPGGPQHVLTPEARMSTTLTAPVLRTPTGGRVARTSDSHDMTAVRAWARSRGYPIDETAGVPLVVLKTYRRVHGG